MTDADRKALSLLLLLALAHSRLDRLGYPPADPRPMRPVQPTDAPGAADVNGHCHPEIGSLVFGCPGCIDRVKADQERTRWAEAPKRRCRWTFTVDHGKRLDFTLAVRVPVGVEPWQVDEQYAGETGPGMVDALLAAGYTVEQSAELFYPACLTIRCVEIGGLVPDVTVPVTDDQPTLFGGAA